jgi:hypothetical protein
MKEERRTSKQINYSFWGHYKETETPFTDMNPSDEKLA